MKTDRIAPKINTVSFGFHCGRGLQLPMKSADQHNEIELNFIESGEMLFRRGAETVKLTQGMTAIYWAAVPHQVVAVKPKTRITWIVLPFAWFLSWKFPVEFNQRMMGEKMLVLDKGQGNRLSELSKDFELSPDLHPAVRLEIEAFVRRLAVHSAQSQYAAPCFEAHQCRHIERMIRTITERFREDISIQDIAESARLAPEYAMRLFRNHWGVTLWTLLIQQRIAEARRLLLLSDATILEIAFACGFQSQSRFYQAFKTQCQCSPGVYRKRGGSVVGH